MLQIRTEQMDVLSAHMMRVYEERVMRKIKHVFPERYEQDGDDKARQFVQAGIRKADGYSITEDDDVEDFVLVLVQYGMDFEKTPEMAECQEILEDEDLPGDAKILLLCEELDFDPEDVKQQHYPGDI